MSSKTTVSLALLLFLPVCFGAACGSATDTQTNTVTNVANANEANVSVAVVNTNSAETLPKQTDSSPVMIKADRLIEEYQADPKKNV